MHRTLNLCDGDRLAAIARVRARVRRVVWSWLSVRPGGFPWLTVAGKRLHNWVIVDMDATIITATSKKEQARATWKKSFGFHPLAAWCANTSECLAMLLRPGNAGSNTVTDHISVLADALAQIPGSSRAKLLIRVDGADATHGLHEHLIGLNTRRRTVRFTTGWTITDLDEQAIARLPETAWKVSVNQDGNLQEDYGVAELSGLSVREGWRKGLRLIVRRAKPSSRHLANLTDFEKKTGFKYSVIATNINKVTRIPGSQQARWLDALHRHHAVVEDRVRTNKVMGLHNLPAKSLHREPGLDARREPRRRPRRLAPPPGPARPGRARRRRTGTMRFRIYHLPARLATHAHRRHLRLAPDRPTKTRKESPAPPRDRGTRRSRSDTRRP